MTTRPSDPDGWYDPDGTADLRARIAELEAQVNHQRVWLEEAARKHDLSAANTRIAELEAELKLEQDASRQAMLEVTQRLVATEAERDRLKAVLTKIANQHTEAEREKEGIEEKDCDFVGAWDAVVEDARAALSGEGVTE